MGAEYDLMKKNLYETTNSNKKLKNRKITKMKMAQNKVIFTNYLKLLLLENVIRLTKLEAHFITLIQKKFLKNQKIPEIQ